jgi:O-antigen/teichoic acid export membrane protein
MRRAIPLLALYGGRVGTAVVGLLALPLLYKVLGPSAFGIVGVILALQALVVMLDLGLAVSTGREAASLSHEERWRLKPLVRHIDQVSLVLHGGVLIVALGVSSLGGLSVSAVTVGATVVGLWALTHQNACLSGIIGRQDFVFASANLFGGVMLRFTLALICLHTIAPTVEVFVLAQGAVLLAQAAITRFRLLGLAGPRNASVPPTVPARVSLALIVLGAAGAAALQLDKPIIGALAGATAVAPYFLASTLAITPITFLAGPVAQYFQPSVILAIAEGRAADVQRHLSRLFAALSVLTIAPGLVLFVGAGHITRIWLGAEPLQPLVAGYLQTLIIGGVVGAFGLIPSMLLIARQQYPFLACVSAAATTMLLSVVALLAGKGDVQTICIAYVIYHSSITLMLWVRASQLVPGLNAAVIDAPKAFADLATGVVRR